jgi:glycosyltransferase involved in cell wall biosynthesis
MNVTVVVSDPTSGLLQYPVDLALCFAGMGHKVQVLSWKTSGQNPDLYQRIQASGVTYQHEASLKYPLGFQALVHGLLAGTSATEHLADLLISFGPLSAWQARGYCQRDGVSLAMIEAMGHDSSSEWKPWLGAQLLNRFTTHVGALCHLERERLSRFGVAPNKIVLIHNWLDLKRLAYQAECASTMSRIDFLNRLNIRSDRKLLSCLASFQPRKRQAMLIRAFAKLVDIFPDYDLLLAGGGAELDACKQLVAELGVVDRVRFLGHLVNDDAMALVSFSDAVAHCSTAETFGYSMVEPLYFEKPTLVTDIAIGYEMKQADVAEVVASDDEQALLTGLKNLMSDGELIKGRVARSRQFVIDNFEVNKIAKQMLGLVSHG